MRFWLKIKNIEIEPIRDEVETGVKIKTTACAFRAKLSACKAFWSEHHPCAVAAKVMVKGVLVYTN